MIQPERASARFGCYIGDEDEKKKTVLKCRLKKANQEEKCRRVSEILKEENRRKGDRTLRRKTDRRNNDKHLFKE